MNRTESLPMVALRGMTILPEMVAHFDISRERSIEAVQEAMASDQKIFLLTQKDVDMANNYVELIERTRSEITPQIGDRLVYVTEHGDYYGNALIDSRSAKEGYLSVCEQPYVPFVWEEDGNIRLSVSGGAFHSVNQEELIPEMDGRGVQGLGALRCLRQRFGVISG